MTNDEKIQLIVASGVLDIADGKATLHFKGGVLLGVQVEKWTYQRQRQSTAPQEKKVIP